MVVGEMQAGCGADSGEVVVAGDVGVDWGSGVGGDPESVLAMCVFVRTGVWRGRNGV